MISNKLGALGGAAALTLCMMASPAAAGDLGEFYVGVGVGAVFADGCELTNCSDSFEDWTWGYKGFVGWQVQERIALEATGHYFGEADDDDFVHVDEFTSMAGSLSVVAQTDPSKRVNYFARVGGLYGRVEEVDGNPLIADESDEGFGLILGLGANYNLGNHATLRGEIEYVPNLAEAEPAGEMDYLMFTLSIMYGH